jgi:hypothetical protein
MDEFGPGQDGYIGAKEKVHPRSFNLSLSYEIVSDPQNQIYNIPQLTKPFTLGPSVVFDLILSYMAVESAWDPRGPHMSVSHVITSLSFLSLPLSLTFLLSEGRPAGGDWGGRRGEAGEEVPQSLTGHAAAATRDKGRAAAAVPTGTNPIAAPPCPPAGRTSYASAPSRTPA